MPDLRLRLHKDMLVVAPLLTLPLLDPNMDGAECLEYLNVLDEDLVRETYRRYQIAGAQCALCNTLEANRPALQAYKLEDALVDINRGGVRLAREAGFEHVVAVVEMVQKEALIEQVEVLLTEDPDAIMIVGGAKNPDVSTAVETVRSLTELPIIAAADADIICCMGASLEKSLLELQHKAETTTLPLMVCPELAKLRGISNKQRASESAHLADELVGFALEAMAAGAQFIGTAPGSSPVYTGAIYAAIGGLDALNERGRN